MGDAVVGHGHRGAACRQLDVIGARDGGDTLVRIPQRGCRSGHYHRQYEHRYRCRTSRHPAEPPHARFRFGSHPFAHLRDELRRRVNGEQPSNLTVEGVPQRLVGSRVGDCNSSFKRRRA